MEKIIFLFLFYLMGYQGFCQSTDSKGEINVLKDARIDALVQQERNMDEIPGFRLQICFDSDKSTVDEARDRFLKRYPKIDTYVEFEAPHFNLKAGDFRTRDEAERIKREIFGEFVICIIHEDLIQLPRIN